MSRNGAPPPAGSAAGQVASARWWVNEGEDLARSITATLLHLKEHQTQRITQWIIGSRLYGNSALVGRAGVTFSKVSQAQPWMKERISWNIVQAASDTVTSRMAKNRPRPLFLTSGGDYKVQRKAKQLNKFCDGVFYENKAYQLGPQAFLDACAWGDGVIHVFPERDPESGKLRVAWERTMACELWVDDLDGFYGEPRSMHRAKDVNREVLSEKAGDWEKDEAKLKLLRVKIAEAPRSTPDNAADYLADNVEVVESWHLPSGPDATDGKHVISIAGAVLYNGKWENPFFPFAFFKWSPRLFGFWAQGLAEQLQSIQLEINTLLNTIKQSFWKGGTFRVFLPVGSKVVKDHITNEIGTVVSYTGSTAPTIVTPPLVQPEIFQHLQSLWQKGFEQAGVSQLTATAQKPAGLDSGAALREYNDIQSDRFMTIGQRYEDFFLQLARLSIATVKSIAKHGSYRVKVPSKGKFIEEIDWKDVNLPDDSYVLKCFPVSSLPQDPAGRQQTITEWVQAGWITARQGRRLMDFPDLEMADNLANAAEEYLTMILEKMADEGVFTAPEPLDDLVLARELCLEFYQRGKVQNLEPDRLELFRRFLRQVQGIEDEAAKQAALKAQQAALQAGAQGAPNAAPVVPQAPPVKPNPGQLVPNAPGPAVAPPPQ